MGLGLFTSKKDKTCLKASSKFLDEKDYETLKKLFFKKEISFSQNYLDIPKEFVQNTFYPQAYMLKEHNIKKVTRINHEIKRNFLKKTYKEFSKNSPSIIPKYFCPEIDDCLIIKKSIILSLLSEKNVNLLIVSDRDNDNKNLFLDSLEKIYPVVSIEKADGFLGLSYDETNKEIKEGAIPKSDYGILAIKEFGTITDKNKEQLDYALENKVIFTKHKKKRYSSDARFKLIATASSKEARFVSTKPTIVNEQIDADTDIFDIVIVIKDIEKLQIEEKQKKEESVIIQEKFSNDSYELNSILGKQRKGKTSVENEYIKDYLVYAESINVNISDKAKKQMVDILSMLAEKYDEKRFLKKPEPKELIIPMVRLAKANAKLCLRKDVKEEDIKEAERIITRSLFAL